MSVGTPLAPEAIFQVAYVVPDLDAAQRYFVERLGIGPWLTPSPKPVVEDRTYRGAANPDGEEAVSFAWVGDLQIELVQPLAGPSIFTEFLAANPSGGLHHFDLRVDDFDQAVAALGGPASIVQSGRIGPADSTAGLRFAFFEVAVLGGLIEIVYLDEATEQLFDDFRSARSDRL